MKRLIYKIGIVGILMTFIQTSLVSGQEKNLLIPGPKGVVVLAHQLYKSPPVEKGIRLFPSPKQQVIVYKSIDEEQSFKKIANLHFPASAQELESRLGDKEKEILSKRFGTSDMSQVYNRILKYGADTLGLTLLFPNIQKVFGFIFIDSTWQKGDKVSYKFERIDASGQITPSKSIRIDGRYKENTVELRLRYFKTFDSITLASFSSVVKPSQQIPAHAVLYTLGKKTGIFKATDTSFIHRISVDSVNTSYAKKVPPGIKSIWYVRTLDLAGNLSAPSDTMYAINYERSEIKPIENLSVTDTSDGLLLQWKALPNVAIYSAIQILKSRQMGRDYVVQDTISAAATNYLDKQVISGTAYYYKVRPLLVPLPGLESLLFTDATGYKDFEKGVIPRTPQGLQAEANGETVALSWLPNPELNLFGYYILRGTTPKNLQVIAGPVKDNHFIDTVKSNGFTGQYVYALQVMNNDQTMSDTSSEAAIFVQQPKLVFSPIGIHARRKEAGVGISWENTRVKDNNIVGYMLYRREKGTKEFKLLNTVKPIGLPAYTDSSASPLISYEYAVTSIDHWGNQSVLSPIATVRADTREYLRPPASVSLLNTHQGIRISWPKPLTTLNKSYVLYRRVIKGEFEQIATIPPAKGVFIDQEALDGILYEYTISVRAGDREGPKGKVLMIRR